MHSIQKAVRSGTAKKALTIFTLILVLVILFFGLRPNTWPNINKVEWLANGRGLLFGAPGFAYADNLHIFQTGRPGAGFSIQLVVAADNLQPRGFKPILMLHDGADRSQLTVSQWGASIIVMNGDDYSHRRKLPRLLADNMLVAGRTDCLTITSGPGGTRLFDNGSLIRENRDLSLKIPAEGGKLRLVLGNSVYGNNDWEGRVYSLTLYDTLLSPEKIVEDCHNWQGDAGPPLTQGDHLRLRYTFEEGKGDMVADQSGNNQPLLLPARPIALKKSFLLPFWHNFSLSRTLLADMVINLLGFLPFGAALYARLRLSSAWPGRYPASVTVLTGFVLSLVIELAQGWLPSRTSSLLDLLLNTTGTGLGVLLTMAVRTRPGVFFRKCLPSRTAPE